MCGAEGPAGAKALRLDGIGRAEQATLRWAVLGPPLAATRDLEQVFTCVFSLFLSPRALFPSSHLWM